MKRILFCHQPWFLLCFVLLTIGLITASPGNSKEERSNNSWARQPNSFDGTSSTTNPIKTTDYEVRATMLLNDASKRMQLLWNRKREIFLSETTKGITYNTHHLATSKQDIENEYRRLVYELAGNLSVIPVASLKSPNLRRQVQRLGKLQLFGLEKEDYDRAKEMLHTMHDFLTLRLVCRFLHPTDCSQTMVSMVPKIALIITTKPKHYDELNYYWQKWRLALGDRDMTAKSTFINFVRLLRKAATYNGHVTPSRTWYLYYETDNFQRELEDVIWEIMPLYRELHAYLRYAIRLNYSHLTAADGAIPHPLMEQLVHSAWIPNTIFHTPYPKSQLPNVQHRLGETLNNTTKELNNVARDFFESLGFKHMTNDFYDKALRPMTKEKVDPDCKSEVSYFPPDVALRYCPKVDYKKLMQRHGDMAGLQYNLYKKELPFGLDSEPCPGFGSALGETAVIASGTPRHLHRLHILDNYTLTAEQAMNRLFRMGVHTILAIPQYFVSEKFLVDVMDGRIGSHEYNCAYWRLQYKYAGVVPPVKRSEKHFDPDYKFYRGLNPEKPNTAKLISEILGHQFYRAVCLASGQYRAGDPDYPLNNCDFYGSSEAGKVLSDMMQLGATKHWRDIMEMATGERRLSAKGVLEYFAPLYSWLKEQNKALGLEAGWDADINCSSD